MFTRIFLFLLLLTFYTCTRSDRIQYEAVQSIDTTEGYQQYLRNNPDSRFLNEVKDKLYRTAYVKTVETNTAKAYDDYIRKYPESPYLEDLIQKKEAVLGCFCCILFINAAICSGVSFAISSKSKPDNSVDSFLPPEGVIFS